MLVKFFGEIDPLFLYQSQCIPKCPEGTAVNQQTRSCDVVAAGSVSSGASGCDSTNVLYWTFPVPANYASLHMVSISASATFTPGANNAMSRFGVCNAAGAQVYNVDLGTGGGSHPTYTFNPAYGSPAFSGVATSLIPGGSLKFYIGNGWSGWCFNNPSAKAVLEYQGQALTLLPRLV